MARKRVPPVQQLGLEGAPAPSPPGRPPIVLELGLRNWGIATWMRDERDVPVYRIRRRAIRTASTLATMTLARDLLPDKERGE